MKQEGNPDPDQPNMYNADGSVLLDFPPVEVPHKYDPLMLPNEILWSSNNNELKLLLWDRLRAGKDIRIL